MPHARPIPRAVAALALLLAALAMWCAGALPASAQTSRNIRAELVAEGSAVPGEPLTVAIRFDPVSPEWHGYWSNPGDAGLGLTLDWRLPDGWRAGEPRYPVPQRLLIGELMNHVYEGEHAVLVDIAVPEDSRPGAIVRLAVRADYLACTDEICVPQTANLALSVAVAASSPREPRFDAWRSAIPPPLDRAARFAVDGDALLLAIPVPAALDLADPHVFVEQRGIGSDLEVAYAAAQQFGREGDLLVARIPLEQLLLPSGGGEGPARITGILAFGNGEGVAFTAEPGDVPETVLQALGDAASPLWALLLAAFAGGLILNVMPCVFPILSIKALSLARANIDESDARADALAYTAGAVPACVALGGLLLALRAGGESVGWAFQLQEPGVVVGLLLLAVAITANFGGVFELPALPIRRGGKPAGAFATGLLAAFVATPCTGPFMAAALGAALVLPTGTALALFAALGLGLALPFLAIGFVPALRRRLPTPGPWMERFRRWMALPMALTALALVWLVARLGGQMFALVALLAVFGLVVALLVVGKLQRRGKLAWPALGLIAAPFALFAAFALPASYDPASAAVEESVLDPEPFDAARLAELRQGDAPVFVWFTADWCVTCKVNESIAIERAATAEAFEAEGVVAMRGDWTRRDPAITRFLTEQGVAGVPLYLWYPGGGAEPQVLPQVLAPDSLVTLADRSRAVVPPPAR